MFYGRRHNGGITPDLRYESVGRGFESLPSHQRNKIRTFFLWERGSDFSFSSRKRIPVQLLLPKSAVEEENHVLSDLVLQKTSSLSF